MLVFTPKMQLAIRFMIKTHEVYQKQKRKGKDIPFISHPLTVGLILARAGASEDVILAGILHDTIEDSIAEKKVTREMLEERFGAPVAELVGSVTELPADTPWDERKREALERISTYSNESVLLRSADVIANNAETLEDYAVEGDAAFDKFSQSKEKTIGYSLHVMEKLLARWPKSPLAEDLRGMAQRLSALR